MQIALSRISPLLTYYHAYPELNDQLQYEWALLDTHDHLTDFSDAKTGSYFFAPSETMLDAL